MSGVSGLTVSLETSIPLSTEIGTTDSPMPVSRSLNYSYASGVIRCRESGWPRDPHGQDEDSCKLLCKSSEHVQGSINGTEVSVMKAEESTMYLVDI